MEKQVYTKSLNRLNENWFSFRRKYFEAHEDYARTARMIQRLESSEADSSRGLRYKDFIVFAFEYIAKWDEKDHDAYPREAEKWVKNVFVNPEPDLCKAIREYCIAIYNMWLREVVRTEKLEAKALQEWIASGATLRG